MFLSSDRFEAFRKCGSTMNNFDCELLLILMEEQNITKTAERLYMSQSSLSYRIKSIEKEMNCTLFKRNKVGITPTKECRIVAAYAKQVLEGYDAMKAKLSALQAPPAKLEKISFGAPDSIIAADLFDQLLTTFHSNYPQVDLSWRVDKSQILVQMLKEKVLDAAIIRGNCHWCGQKVLLFEEPVYFVSRRPLDLDKLPDETYISLSDNPDQVFFKWWKKHYSEKTPQKVIEINTINGSLHLTNQGFGYTVIPALSIPKKKNYITAPLKCSDGKTLTQKTWLYYRPDVGEFISGPFCDYIRDFLPKSMNKAIYRGSE